MLKWSKWHILLKKIPKKSDIKKTKKTFLGNGEGNMCAKFWVSTTNGLGWTLSRYKKIKKNMMRDGNHRLESFKNADLASLIFRSGNTVYLTLVKIQYHYSIACPWKHGWIRSISVVMANVINIITISWQPLYAYLAPLSIWYFSKMQKCSSPKTWV